MEHIWFYWNFGANTPVRAVVVAKRPEYVIAYHCSIWYIKLNYFCFLHTRIYFMLLLSVLLIFIMWINYNNDMIWYDMILSHIMSYHICVGVKILRYIKEYCIRNIHIYILCQCYSMLDYIIWNHPLCTCNIWDYLIRSSVEVNKITKTHYLLLSSLEIYYWNNIMLY
jgi:hypothetical protein